MRGVGGSSRCSEQVGSPGAGGGRGLRLRSDLKRQWEVLCPLGLCPPLPQSCLGSRVPRLLFVKVQQSNAAGLTLPWAELGPSGVLGPSQGVPESSRWQFSGKEIPPLLSPSCEDMAEDATLREPKAGYPPSVQSQRTGSSRAAGKAPASSGLGREVGEAWGGGEGVADPVLPLLLHPSGAPSPSPTTTALGLRLPRGPFSPARPPSPGLVPFGVRGRALDMQGQERKMNFVVRCTGLGILLLPGTGCVFLG